MRFGCARAWLSLVLVAGCSTLAPGCSLPTSVVPGMDSAMDAARTDGGRVDSGPADVGTTDMGPPDTGPCTTDVACGTGFYCAAGSCLPVKTNGTRCGAAHECSSTFCVDGVCCDRACNGTCEGCTGAIRGAGFDGECGPVAANTDPGDDCAAQAATTCGTTGVCDGANACTRWALGTVCSGMACSGGVAQPERACNGAGACNVSGTTSCSPYACGATACLTSCTTDAECDPSAFCSAGVCVSHRPNGSACSRPNDCASGFCADGVCCGTACGGSCVACAATLTGMADGTCSAISAGTDPDAECAASSSSTCGTDGVCSGTGSCRLWSTSTVCTAASCSVGVARDASLCDGAGTCASGALHACPPYVCSGTACATTCATDGDCSAGNYCSAGACVPKQSNGAACMLADACLSGSCVDGFCCNTTCSGTCVACAAVLTGGTDGVCSGIVAGTDPSAECAASAAASCGTDGACDGTGACRFWAGGTVCAPQSCSGGNQVNADLCDGAGHCVDQMTTACAPYLCSGTTCPTTCGSDAECSAGNFCDATFHCVSTLGNGTMCMRAAQCASSNCVDGFCCNTACAGTCSACAAALTGGANGVCGAVVLGTDPQNECAASAAASCGTDGVCNGAGACQLWSSGTTCAAASCAGNILSRADSCNGAGICVDAGTMSCAPYLCSAGACTSTCASDAGCTAGNFCDATSHCVAKLSNGSMCMGANQCASGNCVDGFCCNGACAGTCSACSAVLTGGSNGVCGAVVLGTDPDNECAASAAASCGTDGVCDGAGACQLWSSGTTCAAASCAGNVLSRADSCDGSGICVDAGTVSCAPYLCSAGACTSTCASDAGCAAGNYCDATSHCVAKLSNGNMCMGANQCTSGNCVDGFCCNSACAGTCSACSAALTGGSNGVCGSIPAGNDPDNECAASATSGCGTDGSCSGTGTCRLWASGTVCAAASCAASVASLTDTCNGTGTCVDGGTLPCSPYACSGSVCGSSCTTDTDCASGDLCEVTTCRVPGSTALHVSGDFSGVLLPTNPAFGDVGTSFTIELWFRPSTATVDTLATLFSRRADMGDYAITYSEGSDGLVRFAPWLDDSSAPVSLVSTRQPSIGEWHHVAGVVAGTSVRLYLDGVLEDSATAPSSITWLAADARATAFPECAVFIGYTRSPADGGAETAGRFIGDLDDVRVSDVARYAGATIAVPFVIGTDASTVGRWTFEEPSGTTALDTGATGTLDGTIQGTARVTSAR